MSILLNPANHQRIDGAGLDLLLKPVLHWTRPGFPSRATAEPSREAFSSPSEERFQALTRAVGLLILGERRALSRRLSRGGLSKGRCSTSTSGKGAAMSSLSDIVLPGSSSRGAFLFPALQQTWSGRRAGLFLIPVLRGLLLSSSCNLTQDKDLLMHVGSSASPVGESLPNQGHGPKAAGTSRNAP